MNARLDTARQDYLDTISELERVVTELDELRGDDFETNRYAELILDRDFLSAQADSLADYIQAGEGLQRTLARNGATVSGTDARAGVLAAL